MRHPLAFTLAIIASSALGACDGRAVREAEHGAAPMAEETPAPFTATAIEGLQVRGARLALPAVAGSPGGVFFDLSYNGVTPLTLVGVAVSQAGSAELHDVVDEDGMTRMATLDRLTIGAGEIVSLAPRGKHVMAMNIDRAVTPGGSVEVTLTFEDGRTAGFPAKVVPPGASNQGH